MGLSFSHCVLVSRLVGSCAIVEWLCFCRLGPDMDASLAPWRLRAKRGPERLGPDPGGPQAQMPHQTLGVGPGAVHIGPNACSYASADCSLKLDSLFDIYFNDLRLHVHKAGAFAAL